MHTRKRTRLLILTVLTALLLICDQKAKNTELSQTDQSISHSQASYTDTGSVHSPSGQLESSDTPQQDALPREMPLNDSLIAEALHLLKTAIKDDSILDLNLLGEQIFNYRPIIIADHGDDEENESVYDVSSSFILALQHLLDTPEFTLVINRIKHITPGDAGIDSHLRTLLSARQFYARYPMILELFKRDRIIYRYPEKERQYFSGYPPLSETTPFRYFFELSRFYKNQMASYSYALTFWAEREADSTAALFDTLLQTAARQRGITVTADTLDPPAAKAAEPAPVFFESRSFIDLWANSFSLLDCRDQLVTHYIKEVAETLYKEKKTVEDSLLLRKLFMCCSGFFNTGLTYFALKVNSNGRRYSRYRDQVYSDSNTRTEFDGTWKQITLHPHLSFRYDSKCADWWGLVIDLCIGEFDLDTTTLYAALPTELVKKGITPSGYFPLAADKIIEQKVTEMHENSETTGISKTFAVYPIPGCEKNITNLFLTRCTDGDYCGDFGVSLSVMTSSGDTLLLHEEKDYHDNLIEDPYISDPLLVDINGDKLLDIIIDARSDKRILFLQKPDGGFKKQMILVGDQTGPC